MALNCDPEFLDAYHNKAATYYKNKRYDDAIINCDKAINISETFIPGYLLKGIILKELKFYDKSMEVFAEGLKHENNNLDLLLAYGDILYDVK